MQQLMPMTRTLLCVLGVSAFFATGTSAQSSHLASAEAAYAEIDYERTLEEAQAALEEGVYDPEELARIYELIGKAAAANDDEERSADAYRRLIALRPDAQVDTNLAPRLRSPFLEARGYWASQPNGFAAEVRYVERRNGLRIELSDPLGMAADMIVRTRALDDADFEEFRDVARESTLVPLGDLQQPFEYIVEILDENGNQVMVRGTLDEPIIVGQVANDEPPPPIVDDPEDGGGVPAWVWIVGGVVVAGAAATGLYFGLRQQPITLESSIEL